MSVNKESVVEWYMSRFAILEKGLNGGAASVVHQGRRTAAARFAEIGFPTTKNEEWKYTNVGPISKERFDLAPHVVPGSMSRSAVEDYLFQELPGPRLVFLDGHYVAEFSTRSPLPPGVRLGNLAEELNGMSAEEVSRLLPPPATGDDGFTTLNSALLVDGAFVSIPDDVTFEDPIQILFLSSTADAELIVNPRNVIRVGKRSKVILVERYASGGSGVRFTNGVTEILLGEDAVVEHDKLQDENDAAYHIGTMRVHQERRSRFTSNSIALGGRLVRNNITSVLGGEHSICTLNGLTLATGTQHIDNHTTIDHATPHCNSYELYKSILDGKSRGVFNGKIFVRKDAQKTDAKQTNKTLLLSDEAVIDTKPQLEIFADDVKCTHGATVGQLDAEQLFYMQTRGIGLNTARDVLTFAFASDLIHRIHCTPLRDRLDDMIQRRLRVARRERENE